MKINKSTILNLMFKYGFMIIIALTFIYFSVNSKNFFTLANIFRILHNVSPMMVLASGMALIIIMGEIDISVGTNMLASAAITLICVSRYGMSPIIGTLLGLSAGTLFGALNAFLVVNVGIVPLIATMGTMITFRGIGQALMWESAMNAPTAFSDFGALKIGYLYIDTLLAIVVVVLVYLLHTHTNYGRHLTVLGNGKDTAKRLGISTKKVMFKSFILIGFLASLAGIMSMSQLGSIQLTFGSGKEFTAITLVVLGGISMAGGEGNILSSVLFGGLALNVIETGLDFIGASPYIYDFIQGGIIVGVMYLQSLRTLSEVKVRLQREMAVKK